jgi:hypothetical protein
MIRRWVSLAGKAWGRPPAAAVRGIQREVRRQVERVWAPRHERRFDTRALLAAAGAPTIDALWDRVTQRPFFVTPSDLPGRAAEFRQSYPAETRAILAQADAALSHRFDLLGSGTMTFEGSLPWHEDFKTGRRWPVRYSPDLEYENLDDASDVKVPWELSRCQHLATLGLAFRLSGDPRYAQEVASEIDDWIAANPWLRGVNWICAMDVALRAVSWIWALYLCESAPGWSDREFRARLLRTLYLHGEFIAGHLEKSDVNGNHYLCDGVGLVFLGTLFDDCADAARWLTTGRGIVCDEILRQVHPDGVDFEKSIAYHRLVLEAFLASYLLLQKQGATVPPPALERLHAMFAFVAAYSRSDGSVPLVGDADDGRIQRLGTQDLNDHRYLLSTGAVMFNDGLLRAGAGKFWDESYWLLGPRGRAEFDRLERRDPSSIAFPHGGFYVMRAGATHVFVDCGEVGMDGRGGHGHNDMLAFELVLDGRPVLTDCGSYVYTASREWRNRFRSTAMHNTVQVDEAEINRFISPDDLWRLHDDARPADIVWTPGPERDYFRGAHTGYDRRPYRVRHSREFVLDKLSPSLLLRDRLEGSGRHRLAWRFQFVPGASVSAAGDRLRARIDGRDVWLIAAVPPGAVEWRLEASWVSPRYGVKVPAPAAVLSALTELPAEAAFIIGLHPLGAEEAARVFERFEMVS